MTFNAYLLRYENNNTETEDEWTRITYEPLAIHPCNESDVFADPIESQKKRNGIQWVRTKGFCLDNSDKISIYGNWDSIEYQSVLLQISRCTGFDYCKDDEEYEKFRLDSYLTILANEQNYNREIYDDNVIDNYSTLTNIFEK